MNIKEQTPVPTPSVPMSPIISTSQKMQLEEPNTKSAPIPERCKLPKQSTCAKVPDYRVLDGRKPQTPATRSSNLTEEESEFVMEDAEKH